MGCLSQVVHQDSVLNPAAQGLRDERTALFQHISRVAAEARAWLQEHDAECPVYALLENLKYAPKDFTKAAAAAAAEEF